MRHQQPISCTHQTEESTGPSGLTRRQIACAMNIQYPQRQLAERIVDRSRIGCEEMAFRILAVCLVFAASFIAEGRCRA